MYKSNNKNQDIRPLVTVKVSLANILWTAGQIYTIELMLKSAYQTVSDII